jgi:hypothetical protein
VSEPLSPLEQRIESEAHRFELRPLLELLATLDYGEDDVLFESSHDGRSAGVVKSVKFRQRPIRNVLITVELGLWGDNSLLPSYFQRIAELSNDPNRVYDFVRYFDHVLIQNLIGHLHPEWGGSFRSWPDTLRMFFRMSSPASPSTLHWVTQLHFPELRVEVRRLNVKASSDQHSVKNGYSRLDGAGILGRSYVATIAGLEIDLIAEEESDLNGREWSDIVLLRLNTQLLPLLGPFAIPLVVRLIVLAHASWAKVDGPGTPEEQGYLGYDRLKGNSEVKHSTIMYRGITGFTGPKAMQSAGADVSL